MKRRIFLKTAAVSAFSMGLFSSCKSEEPGEVLMSKPKIQQFGVGLFTIPMWLEQDFAGTLAKLGEIGYKELEFYGPYPYSTQSAHDRWDEITPSLPFSGSGYFGHTPQEVRSMMDANGLSSPSMHTDLETLEQNLDALAEAAGIMGQRYAGIAAIPDELRQSLDDYKRMAERFNEIGQRMAAYDLKLMYHNHGYGLVEMEGKIPMQLILEETDPATVVMEMDVYWTIAGRADPIAYLKEYPGRFKLMHIKDMTEIVHFEGDGGKPEEWIALFPKMADAGAGVLDLKGILSTAAEVGVDHYYLERDMAADPENTLRTSISNLKALQLT